MATAKLEKSKEGKKKKRISAKAKIAVMLRIVYYGSLSPSMSSKF